LSALKFQWARVQAQTLNMQAATEGVPFLPEDFLGLSDRAERIATAKARREVEEMEAAAENMRISQQKMGVTPIDEADVPAWARGKRKNG
jgi:hypothetical protein